jgi:hypothetical protein
LPSLTAYHRFYALSVRQHAPQATLVRGICYLALAQAPFAFPRLFRQDVARKSVMARELSARGFLEPLRGATMRLYFWHVPP